MLCTIFTTYRWPPLYSNPPRATLLTDCHNVCRCVRFKPSAIKISPLLSSFFPSSHICHRDNFIRHSISLTSGRPAKVQAPSSLNCLIVYNVADKMALTYLKYSFECDAINQLFLVPDFNNFECKYYFDWPQFEKCVLYSVQTSELSTE